MITKKNTIYKIYQNIPKTKNQKAIKLFVGIRKTLIGSKNLITKNKKLYPKHKNYMVEGIYRNKLVFTKKF